MAFAVIASGHVGPGSRACAPPAIVSARLLPRHRRGLDAAPKPEQDAVAAIQAEFCVMVVSLKVNGAVHGVAAEPDTPLLYVLRNDLGLNAAKFGCGLGQCGA